MSHAVIPSVRLASLEASGGGMAVTGRIEWPRPEPEPEHGNAWEPSPIRQTMSRPCPGMSRVMSPRCLASPRPLFPTPGKRNKLAFRAIGKRNLYARAHGLHRDFNRFATFGGAR